MAEQETEREETQADEPRSGARANLPALSAQEAVQRLRSGRPVCDVRIEGLVLSGEFPRVVRLKNCLLVKPRFENAIFKEELSFRQCTIEQPHFSGTVSCEGDLVLRGSTLHSALFTRLTVKGTFNAENVHTRGNFGLVNSTFHGTVRFWEAAFHNWFNLKRCTFHGEADLRSLQAHKGMTINGCRFEGPALFRGAAVAMKCDLGDSHFEQLLDFSRAKLNDYVYLESISQGERQRFQFANLVGDRLLVRTEQLVGRLESEQTGNCEQAMHEYATLKRIFGTLHRYEQEDWAFYRFKVNQRRSKPRSWLRPWTRLAQLADWLLLDLGCGYGANPFRAVRAALVIMLGFALIYAAGIDQFIVEEHKLPFPDQKVTSLANRVTIATLTSVSVFSSGVGGIREVARGWMNVPLIAEALLGTLLWGLFIVAFSRKVIR